MSEKPTREEIEDVLARIESARARNLKFWGDGYAVQIGVLERIARAYLASLDPSAPSETNTRSSLADDGPPKRWHKGGRNGRAANLLDGLKAWASDAAPSVPQEGGEARISQR